MPNEYQSYLPGGRLYRYTVQQNWADAKAECEADGARLISFKEDEATHFQFNDCKPNSQP